MGTANTRADRFKNKPKQGGHVLPCTVPKVSHQRGISAVGRFNLVLQGFQGLTWKNGCIQRSKDGVKGPLHEMMVVPTSTSSSESHLAAIIPHSCASTRSYSPNRQIRSDMGQQNHQSVPRPARLPFHLPSWEQCPAKRGRSLTPFSSSPSARRSEIKAVTHVLVSFHTL